VGRGRRLFLLGLLWLQQLEEGLSRELPLMRGMFFLDPTESVSWNYPEQYLLGEHLLIAPVTKESATIWPISGIQLGSIFRIFRKQRKRQCVGLPSHIRKGAISPSCT
jgi:hypothetical protein